jgi:hypothetical protein
MVVIRGQTFLICMSSGGNPASDFTSNWILKLEMSNFKLRKFKTKILFLFYEDIDWQIERQQIELLFMLPFNPSMKKEEKKVQILNLKVFVRLECQQSTLVLTTYLQKIMIFHTIILKLYHLHSFLGSRLISKSLSGMEKIWQL